MTNVYICGMQAGKLVIFSAPSGSGKTTIVRHLLQVFSEELAFSVSATSRAKRGNEIHGKDYYFLTMDEFRAKIENKEFLEWEEVYAGTYYGTLKSEVDRLWNLNKTVIFDIDVEGGLNLKKQFGSQALAVFVMPPSIKTLEERLKTRSTDSEESIKRRIEKAERELQTAQQFDCFILNEDLETAFRDAEKVVSDFLKKR